VVSASRSAASPAGALEATTAAEWEALIDRAIDAAQAELRAAAKS
jgi:hypothetical protein